MLTSLSRSTSRDRPARAAWLCALAAPALALFARSVYPVELSDSREVDLSDPLEFSEATSGPGQSGLTESWRSLSSPDLGDRLLLVLQELHSPL